MKKLRRLFLAAFILGCTGAGITPTFAAERPVPSGEVILVVSGAMSQTNASSETRFDLAMMKSLPATTFQTSTIWTEGLKSFTGVSLKTLLLTLGASGKTLRAVALNDYAVEIPVTDAVENGPIIAYAVDGQPMSIRDKGPLWIVYPYDTNSVYKTEVYYARSIWQLARIEILN
jgi:hypothetical protein